MCVVLDRSLSEKRLALFTVRDRACFFRFITFNGMPGFILNQRRAIHKTTQQCDFFKEQY